MLTKFVNGQLLLEKQDLHLQETAMEQRVIANLSRAMICSLVGKQQSKLIALERQLKASVGIDYREEVLTLWALPQDIDAAVQQIGDLCEAYRYHALPIFCPHACASMRGRALVSLHPMIRVVALQNRKVFVNVLFSLAARHAQPSLLLNFISIKSALMSVSIDRTVCGLVGL